MSTSNRCTLFYRVRNPERMAVEKVLEYSNPETKETEYFMPVVKHQCHFYENVPFRYAQQLLAQEHCWFVFEPKEGILVPNVTSSGVRSGYKTIKPTNPSADKFKVQFKLTKAEEKLLAIDVKEPEPDIDVKEPELEEVDTGVADIEEKYATSESKKRDKKNNLFE